MSITEGIIIIHGNGFHSWILDCERRGNIINRERTQKDTDSRIQRAWEFVVCELLYFMERNIMLQKLSFRWEKI